MENVAFMDKSTLQIFGVKWVNKEGATFKSVYLYIYVYVQTLNIYKLPVGHIYASLIYELKLILD